MNIETINFYIKEYSKVATQKVSSKVLEKLISAPSFFIKFSDNFPTISSVRKMPEKEFLFKDDKITLPFSTIKVIDTFKSPNNEESFFVASMDEDVCVVILIIKISRDYVVAVDSRFRISEFIGELKDESKFDMKISSFAYRLKPDLIALGDHNSPKASSTAAQLAEYSLDLMNSFLLMVNCPRHFTTKVSPSNTVGRSVEWVERKSHYIILGPEHGKQLLNGERKPFDGTITRSMHNRRAHFRRLTSERFTKKRGLKIWVKSSWVGPPEWNDNQGNTYKIINPDRS